jgi:DNA-binding LacI/PurR family transcriptional regulator
LEAQHWGGLRFLIGAGPESCILPQDHQVAGFVFYYDGKASVWQTYLRERRAVPTLWLNLHETEQPAHRPPRHFVTIIPDNRRAGRELGTHLAELGHRRCAFISEFALDQGCGYQRLCGLTEIFPRDPRRGSRSCVVFDGSAAAGGIDPRTGALNAQFDRVVEAMQRQSGLPGPMIRQRVDPGYGVLRWWNTFTSQRPLFEQAFADQSITAWVCACDEFAVLAGAFIREKGRKPGVDLSLAAFDNERIANTLGITSYDFGFDAIGRLAANCLAAPQTVRLDETRSIRIPGQLVARASTQTADAQLRSCGVAER